MDDPSLYWIVIVISLVFSAVFSGLEIAFISANKLRIELDNKQGYVPARIMSWFMKRPSQFIGTMLLGNNIALVIYGIFMALLLEPWIETFTKSEGLVLLTQTVLSTLLILITAEFLPKTLFRINPSRILYIFSIPLMPIFVLLFLPMYITIGLSESLLKLFIRGGGDSDTVAFGRVDLDHYVKDSTDRADSQEELEHEIQIFQNALDFSKVKARDCMIPRTEIIAIDFETDVETVKEKFIETGLSKILVFRGSIDNVIGYVHSYELFKQPETITAILLPISIVPESIPANEILEQLIKQRRGIAVVVDEFGGTSGLVTIEDVIEEIFGEIEDEHDQEELVDVAYSETEFEFSARMEIDQINEKYKLDLPESEEYETLAGLLLHHLEDIPEKGDQVELDEYHFTVEEVSDRKIDRIRLTVTPSE